MFCISMSVDQIVAHAHVISVKKLIVEIALYFPQRGETYSRRVVCPSVRYLVWQITLNLLLAFK